MKTDEQLTNIADNIYWAYENGQHDAAVEMLRDLEKDSSFNKESKEVAAKTLDDLVVFLKEMSDKIKQQ